MNKRLLAVLVSLFALCTMMSSQQVMTTEAESAKSNLAMATAESAKNGLPAPATSWTRTAFEAGVTYGPTDQIGSTTTNCPAWGWAADWYGHSVSWTTGAPSAPTTSGAVAKPVFYNGATRYVVANGTYPVYANGYQYDVALIGQATTTTITLRLHCLDGTYPYVDIPSAQSVMIYDRIPVKEVHIAPATITGGETFAVNIILTAPAQPSNTRVDLKWTGTGLALIGTVPNYVDVAAPATSITLTVPTSKNSGGPKRVNVQAQAKGMAQQATVTIR
jgi:hypothetical protein